MDGGMATGGNVEAVLVADDNVAAGRLMCAMLQKLGCRADHVTDGEAAIAAVESRPYALILMDVHMPRMDGIEATQRIRELPGPAGTVPVIALTADGMDLNRQICEAAGMTDFLEKPISAERIGACLARWLQVAA